MTDDTDDAGDDRLGDDTPQPVELILPAMLEMAPMLRLACAHVATEAGMMLDEVDDLRLVATEVFSSAVGAPSIERISITFEYDDGSVQMMFFAVGPGAIELDDLAARILRSGADELDLTGGTVRFTKLRRSVD